MATLEVAFDTPAGNITKAFGKKPLGMEFVQKMPITVSTVRGEAGKLDVQVGWKIRAIGGETLDDKDWPHAWAMLCKAVEPLHQEFIVRGSPVPLSTVEDCRAKLGPVATADVAPFLERFGFTASDHEKWAAVEQPELELSVTDGHREDMAHTWYCLNGSLVSTGSKPRRWQVERRLAHLRALAHDPVRDELGEGYDKLFEGTHFARYGGPPGTTARLEAWLATFCKLVNDRTLSPASVASMLRFLEAPELSEPTDAAAGALADDEETAVRIEQTAAPTLSEGNTEDGDEAAGKYESL